MAARELQGLRKKAFVSDVNTHLGKVLCKKLTKGEYDVTGTTRSGGTEPQKWVKSVVPRDSADVLKKSLLESDLVIYQLEDGVEDVTASLKILMNSHYEEEKTFILVSSVMTWYETQAAQLAEQEEEEQEGEEEEEPEEEKEQPSFTEEEYTKRVPHVKYQSWKEVEKLCKKANSDTLHTYVIFGGLQYGEGEDKLHPIMKQAWHLAPEGLPVFGSGANFVPMIHVQDMASLVTKLANQDEPLEQRYLFGVDAGVSTWSAIIKAVNSTMGNGKVMKVPEPDFVLYENIEHFIINLKVEPGKAMEVLPEDEWVSQAGFVENIQKVVLEYKEARGILPLRLLIVGPPASGKSYYGRALAAHYKLPYFTIYDLIKDYEHQLEEHAQELERIKEVKNEERLRRQLKELREKKIQEAKEAAEAGAGEEGEEGEREEPAKDDDADEDEDDGLFNDELMAELERMKAEGKDLEEEEEEDDERTSMLKESIAQINMVLAMKVKEKKDDDAEPPNPKDKKKAPEKGKPKKDAGAPPPEEEKAKTPKPPRYTDKCLAFIAQWAFKQPRCQNQGFVFDGYPKTIAQARYLFEDGTLGEIPADPEADEEEEPEEGGERKPFIDAFFPDHIIQLKASDTFLIERIQRIQDQHPHNNPEDFQRRLEFYKNNNQHERGDPKEPPTSLVGWLESGITTENREAALRVFSVEGCDLVPPPPPESKYEKREMDALLKSMVSVIGSPHNYGPSPQEIAEEQHRLHMLEMERKAALEESEALRREKERKEQEELVNLQRDEAARLAKIKAQEREMLEIRKEPLKQYLMTNIIPVLTKGLIEVCEQRPEDPVDYLAEWLFKHNPVEDSDI